MNKEEIYKIWKEGKGKVEIRENFTDEVIHKICEFEKQKAKPIFEAYRMWEVVTRWLPGKVALVVVGILIGFARTVSVLLVLQS